MENRHRNRIVANRSDKVFLMHHCHGQNGQTNSLHLVTLTLYWQ